MTVFHEIAITRYPTILAVPFPRPGPGKMIDPKSAPLSLPVKLLHCEIKKIGARINRSVSLDELDKTWTTLCRLQDALATIRAKSLAD